MGGTQSLGQGKGSESGDPGDLPVPPPSEIPPLQALAHIASQIVRERQQQNFETSLTDFLLATNMSGLEYRLKLAGIHSLEALANCSLEKLCRRGFTPLMARRVLAALEDYLTIPEDYERTPFSVVRPNQELSTRASTLLRSRENYGKMSVKRKGSMAASRQPSPRSVEVKLPTSIPSVSSQTALKPSEAPPSSPGNDKTVGTLVMEEKNTSPAPLSSDDMLPPNPEDAHERSSVSIRLWRSLSVPMGIDRAEVDIPLPIWVRVFSLRPFNSCPALLDPVRDDYQLDDAAMAEVLLALSKQGNTDQIVCALFTLLDLLKEGVSLSNRSKDQCLTLAVKTLHNHLRNIEIAETCCRVLKYLVYPMSFDDDQDLEEVVSVVLSAMQFYSHCKRLQLSGTIIIRSAVMKAPQLWELLSERGVFPLLSAALALFAGTESISSAVISTLTVMVAAAEEARKTLLTKFPGVLELVSEAATNHIANEELQQHTLSFFTLALINMAAQLDRTVVSAVLTVVLTSLEVHMKNVGVVVWGCKALSQLSSHDLMQSEDVAANITEKLMAILATHSSSSGVQMWGSYALYQTVSYNRSLLPVVKNSGSLDKCRRSLDLLDKEAQTYLQHLTDLATL